MSLTDNQIIHLGDGSLGLNETLEVEQLAVSVVPARVHALEQEGG